MQIWKWHPGHTKSPIGLDSGQVNLCVWWYILCPFQELLFWTPRGYWRLDMDKGDEWSCKIWHIEKRNSSSSSNWETELSFYQTLRRVVLTCRCNPSRLFWVFIQRRSIKHNIRSTEKNCSDLEESYKDNARCSSMKNQDTLWNACRAGKSTSSGQIIFNISLVEGVLYTDANDLSVLESERREILRQTKRLVQKRFLEKRK